VVSVCAAPEVISAKTHYDGTKADIWSCGVMLYVMLFCEYPFERPEDDADKYGFQKVLDRIMRVDYRIPKYCYNTFIIIEFLTLHRSKPYFNILIIPPLHFPWKKNTVSGVGALSPSEFFAYVIFCRSA
jgi:serine/threonine protein kinase